MNWFKEKLNKLFYSEIEEDNYKEVSNEINNPLMIPEDRNVDSEIETKKSSFKFPLIDDNEKMPVRNLCEDDYEEIDLTSSSKNVQKRSTYFYQPNAISEVYEVEVSGISELLAKRQKSKGTYNSLKKLDNYKKSRIQPTIKQEKELKEKIEKLPLKKKTNYEDDKIPVSQRRFIPTQVPSPIHGFRKPSNINDLITKKHVREGLLEDVSLKREDEENKAILSSEENMTVKTLESMYHVNQEIASTVDVVELVKDTESTSFTETMNHDEVVSFKGQQDDNVNEINLHEKLEDTLPLKETLFEEDYENDVNNEEVSTIESVVMENKVEDINLSINEGIHQFERSYDEDEANIYKELHEEALQVQSEILEEHGNGEEILNEQVARLVDIALIEEDNIEERLIAPVALVSEEVQASPILKQIEEIDEVTDDLTEETRLSHEEKVQETKSTLPFNVLMLKSDKEKYAMRLAQNVSFQHKVDMNERNCESIEADLHIEEQLPVIDRPNMTDKNVMLDGLSIDTSHPVEEKLSGEQEKIVSTEKSVTQDVSLNGKAEEENEHLTSELSFDLPSNESVDEKVKKVYIKPSMEFLLPPEEKTEDRDWLESQADVLVEALSHFQVTAQVESIMQGPAVTQFEITVGHGTKVSKIRNLADDLKLALAAKDIRIQAPIPGKSSIGIEIPNRISRAVRLSEVTNSESFIESESPLEAALGLDLTGKPVTIDLRKMPHGLIAGATGSGKSVCINSVLVSLLYKADPQELKLMLIDPKMVELAPFNHIPHLVSPVITDVKAATAALKWAVEEMERRYQLFAHAGVRDLSRFNRLAESNGDYGHKLPYILIVIDELADLMMMSPADVEEAICRIAQKARACGIHLIVATQRPSVDVITGLIKSNIPTRIAFAVSSQIDSRTILDSQGAERLLGRGDMLYLGNGMSAPIRLQGTFVTDDEIEEIIEHVRAQGEPEYVFQQDELLKKAEIVEEQDELFEEVCRFVYEQGSASTSSIQRKYHIGYNRAARLIDMLESQGFISEQRGSKAREVYITESDLESMFE